MMLPLLSNDFETGLSALCDQRGLMCGWSLTLPRRVVSTCMISAGGCGSTNRTAEGSCLGSHHTWENNGSTFQVHQNCCGSCVTCCSRSQTTATWLQTLGGPHVTSKTLRMMIRRCCLTRIAPER